MAKEGAKIANDRPQNNGKNKKMAKKPAVASGGGESTTASQPARRFANPQQQQQQQHPPMAMMQPGAWNSHHNSFHDHIHTDAKMMMNGGYVSSGNWFARGTTNYFPPNVRGEGDRFLVNNGNLVTPTGSPQRPFTANTFLGYPTPSLLADVVDRAHNDSEAMEMLVHDLAMALPQVGDELNSHRAAGGIMDPSSFSPPPVSSISPVYGLESTLYAGDHSAPSLASGGGDYLLLPTSPFQFRHRARSKMWGSSSSLASLSEAVAAAAVVEGGMSSTSTSSQSVPWSLNFESGGESSTSAHGGFFNVKDFDPERNERVAFVIALAESERERRIAEAEENSMRMRLNRAARIEWAISLAEVERERRARADSVRAEREERFRMRLQRFGEAKGNNNNSNNITATTSVSGSSHLTRRSSSVESNGSLSVEGGGSVELETSSLAATTTTTTTAANEATSPPSMGSSTGMVGTGDPSVLSNFEALSLNSSSVVPSARSASPTSSIASATSSSTVAQLPSNHNNNDNSMDASWVSGVSSSFISTPPATMESSSSNPPDAAASTIPLYLQDYEVICPYIGLGCDATLRRSELPKHLEECPFKAEVMESQRRARAAQSYNPLDHVVVCPYALLGCPASCRRADLPAHLAACAYRAGSRQQQSLSANAQTSSPVSYPPPTTTITSTTTNTMREQYEVVCPYTILGCRATFLRSELDAHLAVCAFRPRSRQEEEDERQVNRKYAIEAEETERIRRAASDASGASLQNQAMPSSSSMSYSGSSSYIGPNVRSALLESILRLQQQPPQLHPPQGPSGSSHNPAAKSAAAAVSMTEGGERTRRLSLLVQAAEIERMRRNEEQMALKSRNSSGAAAGGLPNSPLARASLEETLRRGRLHRQSFPEEAILGRRTHANSFHDHLEHQTKVLHQALHEEIERYGRECSLWEFSTQSDRRKFVAKMKSLVEAYWPKLKTHGNTHPQIYVFGSFATELAVPGVSDLDLVLYQEPTTTTTTNATGGAVAPHASVRTPVITTDTDVEKKTRKDNNAFPSPPTRHAGSFQRSLSGSAVSSSSSLTSNRSTLIANTLPSPPPLLQPTPLPSSSSAGHAFSPELGSARAMKVSPPRPRSTSMSSALSSFPSLPASAMMPSHSHHHHHLASHSPQEAASNDKPPQAMKPQKKSNHVAEEVMRLETRKRCQAIGDLFRGETDFVRDVRVIDNASVPIIKMRAVGLNLAVDLSFAQPAHDGVAAANLIRTLRTRFPPLAPLVRVLKAFLSSRGLSDPYTGGLSSYALVLMTTASLIRSCERAGRLASSLPYGELLSDFLDLYGREFDPAVDAVVFNENADMSKLGMGRLPFNSTQPPFLRIDRKEVSKANASAMAEEGGIGTAASSSSSSAVTLVASLVVDDPVRLGNNVGRPCFAFNRVQAALAETLASLLSYVVRNEAVGRSRAKSNASLLEVVFGVPPFYSSSSSTSAGMR